MLAYLVLTGANAAPVDPAVVARLTSEPPSLPFDPEDHLVWTNTSGTVVVLAWQAFTDLAGIGSHWAVHDGGLTLFAGMCWPRDTGWNHRSGVSWGSQLQRWLERHPLPASREALYGQFTVVSLSRDGTGSISTDFSGFDPVFVTDGDDLVAIANRAGLCAHAVAAPGSRPGRSLTGAGWVICHTEMFFDGDTGYWDVERLSLGAHIAIAPGTPPQIVEPTRSPLGPVGPDTTYAPLLDAVELDLRQSLRRIAELPLQNRHLSLSGGIDSRILTAAIIDEGLQDHFRFITFGTPYRSDVIAARAIAHRFQLDWAFVDHSERSPDDERAEVRTHAALVEGMTNAWNAAGATTFSGSLLVSGLVGEYVRWGKTSRAGMSVTTEAEMLALLRKNISLDPLGIVRPDVLEFYRGTIAHWAADQLARGESLQQIPSYFNQSGQARHRFAVTQAWGERPTLTPFVTPTFVRANQQLPVEKRPDHRFQVDLMNRFQPELALMPFAAQGWSEEIIAHLPDADRYRAIAPIRTTDPEGHTWRVLRYRDYRPFLEEFLLDRSNPIHELIDAERLQEALATGDRHPGRTRRLWAVLTAAIWMGHHESTVRIRRI